MTEYERILASLLDARDAQRPNRRQSRSTPLAVRGAEKLQEGDRVPWMPDGREARVTRRGRQQTSHYRAMSVAERTLTTRIGEVEQPPARTKQEWHNRMATMR